MKKNMWEIKRAKEIYKEEGLTTLIKKSARYGKNNVIGKQSGQGFQISREEQTKKRWKAIEKNISEEDNSLIDIGCDSAILTANAARMGLLAIGVDRYEVSHSQKQFPGAFEHAHELSKTNKNLGIINKQIKPENVHSLPDVDVVLLLSVYHYWYREFGKRQAESMLESFKGANKVFFSSTSLQRRYNPENYAAGTNENIDLPSFIDEDRESVVEYHKRVLESTLGEEYSIKYINDVPYEGETRYLMLAKK